jgi:hypothetical protein
MKRYQKKNTKKKTKNVTLELGCNGFVSPFLGLLKSLFQDLLVKPTVP